MNQSELNKNMSWCQARETCAGGKGKKARNRGQGRENAQKPSRDGLVLPFCDLTEKKNRSVMSAMARGTQRRKVLAAY